jgi:hypothetical protein
MKQNKIEQSEVKQSRTINWPLLGLIILFIIMIFFFAFKPGGEEVFNIFNRLITLLLPLMAILLGIYLLKVFSTKSLQGKAILFFTISFFLYWIGDIIWMFYKEAVVSPADIFFLLFYIPFMVAIICGIRMSNPDTFTNKRKIIILSLITLVIIAAYLIFFPFSWDPAVSFIENLVTAGYVVGDLILIIPLVFLCYSLLSGALSFGWVLIFFGYALTIVGDLGYALNYSSYAAGNLIDLTWNTGFLLFIYAFIRFLKAQDKAKQALIEGFKGLKKVKKAD